MQTAQAALFWIANLLEKREVVYRISGGLAARVYGSKRQLADIDIEVEPGGIATIFQDVSAHIKCGPNQYRDSSWDVRLLTLRYEEQEIDIFEPPVRIFNTLAQEWEVLPSRFHLHEPQEIFGRVFPIEPRESLLDYKKS